MCVKAHELISDKTNHPLHVGITEAGTIISGNIKSAIGLGLILNQASVIQYVYLSLEALSRK